MGGGKRRWKIILEYEIGILILALVVAAAWFGPDLYTSWQDERREGQVVLSSRENIRFLDVDSLDIAGRMSLLKGVERLEWVENIMNGSDQQFDAILQRTRRIAGQWVDCGVIPEDVLGMIPESVNETRGDAYLGEGGSFSVLADNSALNVLLLISRKYVDTGTENRYAGELGYSTDLAGEAVFVVDVDRDLFYYVGFYGQEYWDWMAQQLVSEEYPDGFSSFQELREFWMLYGILPTLRLECPGDLSGVCSALGVESGETEQENAAVSDPGAQLYTDVLLGYEKFDGFARCQLSVSPEIGFGFGVMLGTPCWSDFVMEVTSMYTGYGRNEIRPGSVDDWVTNPFGIDWNTEAEAKEMADKK